MEVPSSIVRSPLSTSLQVDDDIQLKLGCFGISPISFALQSAEALHLHVEFTPPESGEHTVKFVVLCDNGTAMTFLLTGRGANQLQ